MSPAPRPPLSPPPPDPYLVHNPQTRSILAELGYEYDSSILEPFNSATSPSWAERTWPYTMDGGIPQASYD